MNSKATKSKLKEIATKVNLPESTVESVVRSQFEFAHTLMTSPELVSIRLRYIGLIANVRLNKR
jgi:hypothetical protein